MNRSITQALVILSAAVVNDDTDHWQTLHVRLLKPHDVRDLRTGQVVKRTPDNTLAVTFRSERRITRLAPGRAAMWPHWQPFEEPAPPTQRKDGSP